MLLVGGGGAEARVELRCCSLLTARVLASPRVWASSAFVLSTTSQAEAHIDSGACLCIIEEQAAL